MSALIVSTNSFKRALHKNKQRVLPVWLFRWMGYSSFAAVIVSMLVYWYKKTHFQQRQHITSHTNKELRFDEDVLVINPRRKLHISTDMRRSSSSLSNLSSYGLITPPPSPHMSRTNSVSPTRALSPRSWSSRLMDGVLSAARIKKKMTISLKNVSIKRCSPAMTLSLMTSM